MFLYSYALILGLESCILCLLPSVFCLLASDLCPRPSVLCLLPSVLCLLTSDLCLLSSLLYNCRERFTNPPFLCKTNPILSAVGGLRMNVTSFITKYYENKWQRRVRKNKPNSNPIQTQSKPIQSQSKPIQCQNKAKTNPIKLEANLSLRERRSLRVSFSESSNRGPIKLEANLSLRERRTLRVGFSESSNRGPISNAKKYVWGGQNI